MEVLRLIHWKMTSLYSIRKFSKKVRVVLKTGSNSKGNRKTVRSMFANFMQLVHEIAVKIVQAQFSASENELFERELGTLRELMS